jgi:hypothetical protein
LFIPIIAYTLSSTKLEIRANSFCRGSRWWGEGGGRGIRERVREGGRNDPNIVYTYKENENF